MAKSRIPWIDSVFDWCVYLLVDAARFLGVTYEEINVWLFCILWPLVTVIQTCLIVWLWIERRNQ